MTIIADALKALGIDVSKEIPASEGTSTPAPEPAPQPEATAEPSPEPETYTKQEVEALIKSAIESVPTPAPEVRYVDTGRVPDNTAPQSPSITEKFNFDYKPPTGIHDYDQLKADRKEIMDYLNLPETKKTWNEDLKALASQK